MNDMSRPVHKLRGTGAMAAIYADFDARVSNVEIAKKHDVRTETIRRHHVKWRGDGKRPIDGPSKAQIEREAQAKRDADLAASARRAALLATKGEIEALRALRQRPDFMLTNDGRHVVTIAALKTEYDAEIQKGKK
jgi:hypothetical protein